MKPESLNQLFNLLLKFIKLTAQEFTGPMLTHCGVLDHKIKVYLPLVDLLLVFFKDISLF